MRGLALAILVAVAGALLFTLSAYLFDPLLLPAILLGVAALLITVRRPDWGLTIAFLMVPAELVSLPLPTGALSPSEALLILVGVGWLARWGLRVGVAQGPQPRDLSIGIILLVVAIGLVLAEDAIPVLRVLIMWSLLTCVYFQVQTFSVEEIRNVLIGLAIGGGVLGLIGASQYIASGNTTLYEGGTITSTQAIGTFTDPNYYAACLTMSLLPALALALTDFRRYAWLLAAAAGSGLGIILSLSRGGILAAVIGVLVFLLWRRSRPVVVGVIALLVAMTMLNANPLIGNEYSTTVSERLSSLRDPAAASNRPEIWRVAQDTFNDNPVFGVGVNQFRFEAASRGLYEDGAPLENAHSIPWSLAAETGLAGLLAFAAFAVQIFLRARYAIRSSHVLAAGLALGLTAALVAFTIQGLTVVLIRVPLLFGIMMTFAGMITALADLRRREEQPVPVPAPAPQSAPASPASPTPQTAP